MQGLPARGVMTVIHHEDLSSYERGDIIAWLTMAS